MGSGCGKPESAQNHLDGRTQHKKATRTKGSKGTAVTEGAPSFHACASAGSRGVLAVPESTQVPLPSRPKAAAKSLRLKGGELLVASTYNEVHRKASSNLENTGLYRSNSKRFRPVGVVGMNNMGNTCYFNSSLQCLSATIPLTDYFLGYNYRAEINRDNVLGTKGKLATAYADLMIAVWSGKSLTIRPKAFQTQLVSFAPQFAGNQQHDAHELLALMLDGIHEDLNRIKVKPYIEDRDCDGLYDERDAMEAWKNYLCRNKSIIVDIFQGQMRSCLTCLHCEHRNVRFEPFMYLSLPMTSACRSLQDCIELYLAPENLSGENQWFCSACNTHRDAIKKTDIWILPPILIVHLKRFKFDDFGNSVGSKNSAPIDYPIENWNLKKFVKSQSSDKPIYDLYAVANHFGGMGSGHYTAYAMSRFENEEWYEFNDSQTKRIPEESLRNNQSAAYLLFYNRRRTNSAGSPDRKTKRDDSHGAGEGRSLYYHRKHHERRIPLVRRQSVNRPDLWPHTQVHHHQFREFSRTSVRVMEVAVLETKEVHEGSDTFETSLETKREVHWEV